MTTLYFIPDFVPNRPRERWTPEERKNQLLMTYVAMSIGDIDSPNNYEKPHHYLAYSAVDISEYCGVSVATVFNYFPDVASLHDELSTWAQAAVAMDDFASKQAAETILKQLICANPDFGKEIGLELVLEVMPS